MVSELLNTKLLNYTKAVNRPVRQKKSVPQKQAKCLSYFQFELEFECSAMRNSYANQIGQKVSLSYRFLNSKNTVSAS